MRRLLRVALWVLLLPPMLMLLLGIALYIPVVQDAVVSYVTARASESLGMRLEIGRLRLSFPLALRLDRVALIPAAQDTLLRLEHATLSLRPLPLLRGRVEIPQLTTQGLYVRYRDSLNLSKTHLDLNHLALHEVHLNPNEREAYLAGLQTQGGRVLYHSTDTTTTEPTPPLGWHIIADALSMTDTHIEVSMPLDSLYVAGDVSSLTLSGGDVRLDSMPRVEVAQAGLEAPLLCYRQKTSPAEPDVLDVGYVALSDVALRVSEVLSQGTDLIVSVDEGRARERSGISLNHLQLIYTMDEHSVAVEGLALRTDHSSLFGSTQFPWALLRGDEHAAMKVALDGSIGMPDLRHITGHDLIGLVDLSERERPNSLTQLSAPLSFDVYVEGTLMEMSVHSARLVWEEVLDMDVSGEVYDLHLPRQRRGSLTLQSGMQYKANSLLGLLSQDVAEKYNIPDGVVIDGSLRLGGGRHALALRLRDRDAVARITGHFDEYTKAYGLSASLSQLNLRRYMPRDSIGHIQADLEMRGRGFDPLHPRTSAQLTARIQQLEYQQLNLQSITADGTLSGGELSVAVNSFNPGLNASLLVDGLLSRHSLSTNVVLDSEEIDLAALGFSTAPLRGHGRLSGELRSDLNETHSFVGRAEDVFLALGEESLSPEEVTLDLRTTPIDSRARITSGDLHLQASIRSGPHALAEQGEALAHLVSELEREVVGTLPMQMRLEQIIAQIPAVDLDLEMGQGNALMTYLKGQRIALERAEGHVRLRPSEGLEGHISLRDIRQDTMRINCLDLDLRTLRYPRTSVPSVGRGGRSTRVSQPDSMALLLTVAVDKQAWRRQRAFSARTELWTTLQQLRLDLAVRDGQGRVEHCGALRALWDGAHYRLELPEPGWVLSYRPLEVNTDNYIALEKSRYLLSGGLSLTEKSGTALHMEASDLDGTGQSASLIVRQLRLEDYRSLGLPDLSGILGCDIRYTRVGGIEEQPVITGDLSVQEFAYEGKKLGHFATALFYEPRNDTSHYITAQVSYEGTPALSLDGIYQPTDRERPLRGSLSLSGFPLEIANPFVAQYATYLRGTTSGELELSGSLTDPRLVGALRADTTTIELRDYATTLRLDTADLRLSGTTLHLDRYAVYSAVDPQHPIYLYGQIEALGARAMETDLHLQTDETTLFDQKNLRTDSQLVYGRLVASADLRLTGALNALRVRGQLGILGGTSCNYVMREGALDATDHRKGLVSFVDFADTLFTARPVHEAELGGMNVNLSLRLDPSVRFGVDLTADGRDYVRMQGGGLMQLRYLPFGEMSLIGRYEMTGGGTMHYTMPVVGGKLFQIDPSGYVRFEGDVANPYVYLRASQQVRATASSSSRTKTPFTVSIRLEDYVEKLNLSFDVSAPENLSVQNELSMMTAEERGKQAIGLLATGTYLAAGAGNFDGALTSLLQNQINSVAGSLLRGTDISLGMETGDEGSGAYTNYTYSFSRRFYNDRIRIIVGGKIQTGNTAISNKERSLVDNVSLEYQIDKAGEHYGQIYHSLVTDNVLEGEYTETGLGYNIRRKLQRVGDLFIFRRRVSTDSAPDSAARISTWQIPLLLPTDTTNTRP